MFQIYYFSSFSGNIGHKIACSACPLSTPLSILHGNKISYSLGIMILYLGNNHSSICNLFENALALSMEKLVLASNKRINILCVITINVLSKFDC